MKEALSFSLVLFLVYLSQCFASAPPFTVVFLVNDRLRGQLLKRVFKTSSAGRRIFLHNPFLFHIAAIYTEPAPFAVRFDSAGKFSGLEALAHRPENAPRFLSFETVQEIEAYAKDVVVDDEAFLSLRSTVAAEQVAQFLSRVQRAPGAERAFLFERYFKSRFDTKAIANRLERYSRSTAYLPSACFALFFFVFLIGPVAIFFLGLHRVWLALLLYILFTVASILWLFLRAYRNLHPQSKAWPLQHMVTITLSPFAAIRANDLLAAELLSEFHPLAVGQCILPKPDFLAFAGTVLRKAEFLDRDVFMVGLIRAFLANNHVRPESLLEPPPRDDARSQSYCPVCRTQYVIAAGVCQDCDDTTLLPF
jgi:hypothetical protein